MLWKRDRNRILDTWRSALDYSLEAGGAPLFDFGISHNTLDGLLNLTVLQDFVVLPQPLLAHPQLTIGGNSPLWLLTTDHYWLRLGHDEEEQSDESFIQPKHRFQTTFTAVDPATHMASLTVNTGSAWRINNRSPMARSSGLPLSVRSLTSPQLEPGVISTWQALPLTMSLTKHPMHSLHLVSTSGNALNPILIRDEEHTFPEEQSYPTGTERHSSKPEADNLDYWIATASLLLVFMLILISLIG